MKFRFDFIDCPYYFTNPHQIIQANKLDDVIPCMQAIENAVQKGYYAAGFISYEAAPAFCSYLTTYRSGSLPLLWFGLFDHPEDFDAMRKAEPHKEALSYPNWHSNISWQDYQNAIYAVKDHIAKGDTYQVNYTLQMQAQFQQNPYRFYLHLLQAQQSRYSAYLESDTFQILSASPELFFEINKDIILTKPMKGTVPRGVNNIQDQINQQVLHNEKNHAENLMITDLLRNDLGQIAQQGTVKVTSLFDAEKYPTVWQLTSTITAQLKKEIALTDIFKALFPCGSITGAPKVNTMNIIRQLEKSPRGVYCGALGVITPNQQAIFSVPIRTMVIQNGQATYGVGGGITWDSTPKNEYEEVLHKVQVLYQSKVPEHLLESLLLGDGKYFLYIEHLQRLKESAQYFDFIFDEVSIAVALQALQQKHSEGLWKVRLLLDNKGRLDCEAQPIKALTSSLTASWATQPMQTDNVFLYHKTTTRDFYPKVTLDHENLLFNEKEEVTEFVNGNFVLNSDGEWFTPPLQSGLLNGTMRQHLLQKGKIKERIIYKKDIQESSKIAFINSVRGWRDVNFNIK
ncbi:aminodeoxychorismate synthase component I [Commensalibacter papalotli (ex Botero et al. 2024)]|uniref:Probable branched-chain-amino-acid aminotransferase n=1 Tax=Commensalibacter papalotli (ex Botero et al. 2024) TaxID=2972766 RepID=A0ABM9HM98_9PROT|nr:aminodeoxychorismate synthase component I [Commensalibacter papalotli (ex Botero et al. 2024)]CAI3934550.1 Branched-chain amino acid aminotransferase/4-amino-4-deoxychorismate lyase (IlvE) (PDB:1A3G) [Commensalibacter papalotli (ex Botero et al. 2024)]CAI3950653.1 Branched-chain amino acid aminotransferase/4-amino-4-deoxychorismate lyase (IlvE) (PDB:1A3G) [Commensalibacter papalotli (ex Botero et al. 2024)]